MNIVRDEKEMTCRVMTYTLALSGAELSALGRVINRPLDKDLTIDELTIRSQFEHVYGQVYVPQILPASPRV